MTKEREPAAHKRLALSLFLFNFLSVGPKSSTDVTKGEEVVV